MRLVVLALPLILALAFGSGARAGRPDEPPVTASTVTGTEPADGVTVTTNAEPEQFLPRKEWKKVRDVKRGLGPTSTEDAASQCSNLVVENGQGEPWAWPTPYFREYLQLYWCWNYVSVTYCYRARGISGARSWEFINWIGWGGSGGAGDGYCSVSSQGQWKLTRFGLPDAWCYPNEYELAYPSGSYYWLKSGC